MKYSVVPAMAMLISTATAAVTVYTTITETDYTTYCPTPTTISQAGLVYVATAEGTLTISSCPCTVTLPSLPTGAQTMPILPFPAGEENPIAPGDGSPAGDGLANMLPAGGFPSGDSAGGNALGGDGSSSEGSGTLGDGASGDSSGGNAQFDDTTPGEIPSISAPALGDTFPLASPTTPMPTMPAVPPVATAAADRTRPGFGALVIAAVAALVI